MQDWGKNSILDWRRVLDAQEISAVELAELFCAQVEKLEPQLNALISYDRDAVLAQAKVADEMMAAGKAQLLTGIPIVVKDNISTDGVKTTAGSKMLANFVPTYDATVVKRLKEAGAVIVGKANMDEFAMGSSNETSFFGPVKNPWDLTRVSGGSSGGSTVSAAAGYCLAALGSDTGGSIRQPASLCGVVGLKPTYGRVSRYGLLALGSSLDQIGPLGRRVEDVAAVLQLMAGADENDSTTAEESVPDYLAEMEKPVKGWQVGLVKELYEGVSPALQAQVEKAVQSVEELGVTVERVSLPELKYCIAVYYIIQSSECSANLARYDGIKYGHGKTLADLPAEMSLTEYNELVRQEGFGPEVKRRIMLGTYALSSGFYDHYFQQAAKVRSLMIEGFKRLMTSYDMLMGLVSPVTAFKLGEKIDDPLSMYLSDVMTCGINLIGGPAVSVPLGMVDNLPVGWQLIGDYFAEGKILNLAKKMQDKLEWPNNLPPLIKETRGGPNG
jgi:aspartyl-tRNA(Asn)/glutamyl-tRNA(Gln) amidotransferase subunit A